MKNKLVFIRNSNTPFGGAERYLGRLTQLLSQRGCEAQTLNANFPRYLPSWFKTILFNAVVCHRKQKDIFYFSLDRITCPDIYRAGDGVHKAFLKTKGLTLNPLHLTYLWLEKRTFSNAKIIIANSQMVKSQILEHYPIDESKVVVIYNGVPIPDSFNPSEAKASLAKEFSIDAQKPIILFVGSGFARKGVEEYLRILSRLKSSFTALVVGKEKHLKKYQQLARNLGLVNRVIFTGPRKDVETFYTASDIFLFPTRYEPFSNVVLEAMSYGCATFTTRQNGAHEILPDECIMKSPEDFTTAARIDTLLKDPARLRKAQKDARSIAEKYSIEENVRQTLDVIEKVAAEQK